MNVNHVLKVLAVFLVFAITTTVFMGFFWLSGVEFVRGGDLAFSLFCSVSGGFCASAALIDNIDWRD